MGFCSLKRRGGFGKESPSGAKARFDFAGFLYGLKPVPFADLLESELVPFAKLFGSESESFSNFFWATPAPFNKLASFADSMAAAGSVSCSRVCSGVARSAFISA